MIPKPLALALAGSILFIAAAALPGQEAAMEDLPLALRQRAVVLDIIARVIEQNHEEVWNSVNSKVTIPGKSVGIKLVGANIVIMVQFTPYQGVNGRPILVAQGQIWIDIPNEGLRHQTTLETIPLEYGEQIFFFPLGSAGSPDSARIEIQVALRPYLDKFQGEGLTPVPVEQTSPGDPAREQSGVIPRGSESAR